MTSATIGLTELAEKGADIDVLRQMVPFLAQGLIELDVEGRCGAGYDEKNPERLTTSAGAPPPTVRSTMSTGPRARWPARQSVHGGSLPTAWPASRSHNARTRCCVRGQTGLRRHQRRQKRRCPRAAGTAGLGSRGRQLHRDRQLRAPSPFGTVPVSVPVQRHTYALRVHGDSMVSETGDSFPGESPIIVEPELPALPGDHVVALNSENETTFKQLVKDGGDLFLKPLSLRYPVKPLASARAIGVVREFTKRFR